MLPPWLFLFVLQPLVVPALERYRRQTAQLDETRKPCQDREIHNSTVLGGLLLKAGQVTEQEMQMQNLPNITYLEFAFQRPVIIRGWDLKGREGSMFGPLSKRRGYVASYVVTYVPEKEDKESGGARSGSGGGNKEEVDILQDPETHQEEFVTDSNLARPEAVTDVDLKEILKTRVLRMAPVVWSGVPYMSVKLFFCATDGDLNDEEKKALLKEEVDESLSVKDMENELKQTRTSGVIAAAIDATKNAMGIKTPLQETEEYAEKPPHLPFTQCPQPPIWRYAAKPTPVDTFSARGNPQQAWRAIMGVSYPPYLFPTTPSEGPRTHQHQLLEILFRNRSHITALKVAGLGEAGEDNGRWGLVTKFSLLYKNSLTDKWVYYSDSTDTPRVFTVGNRTREDAQRISIFHLPVAMTTDALGIFPHEWLNKPYLALDLLACYIRGTEDLQEEGTTGGATSTREGKQPPAEGDSTLEGETAGTTTSTESSDTETSTTEMVRSGTTPNRESKGDLKILDIKVKEEIVEGKPPTFEEEVMVGPIEVERKSKTEDEMKTETSKSTRPSETEKNPDIQKIMEKEKQIIDSLDIPQDLKNKLKEEENDVGAAMGQIEKDVQDTLNNTTLEQKHLKPKKTAKQKKNKAKETPPSAKKEKGNKQEKASKKGKEGKRSGKDNKKRKPQKTSGPWERLPEKSYGEDAGVEQNKNVLKEAAFIEKTIERSFAKQGESSGRAADNKTKTDVEETEENKTKEKDQTSNGKRGKDKGKKDKRKKKKG